MADVLYEKDGTLIVLPTGAGKTATGLTAALDLKRDGHIRCMLVLGPKRIVEKTWPDEPGEWEHLKGLKVVAMVGDPLSRTAAMRVPDGDVYLCSFSNLNWLCDILDQLPEDDKLFDFLLIDEMSKLGKNARGKLLRRLALLREKFKQVHGMTGTPRPNGYEDLFAPLRFLSKRRIFNTDFDQWRAKNFQKVDAKGKPSEFGFEWRIRPEHEPRIMKQVQQFMITIDPDELPELPGVINVPYYFDLPKAIMRDYKKMEKDLLAQGVAAMSAGVASGKCEQIVQGYLYGDGGNEDVTHLHDAKIEQLQSIVDDLDGDPAVIAYGFKEDLRILQRLYPGIPFLGAGVGGAEANQHIDDWNAKRLPLMGIHPASAAHGLNLQHGGQHVIWFNLTWSAENYEQLIARLHRQGQLQKCYNHLILARRTTDEVKLDRVEGKMTMQEAFNRHLKRV